MTDRFVATPAAPAAPAPTDDRGEPRPEGPRVNILVVDDNALNAKLLRLALEAQGYAVRVAASAAAARAAVASARPALVLLDVQLPDGDGLAVLREMRADATLAQLPVMVVSAFAAGEDLDRAYAAGADAFVPKPVNVRSLLRILASLVATYASTPSAETP